MTAAIRAAVGQLLQTTANKFLVQGVATVGLAETLKLVDFQAVNSNITVVYQRKAFTERLPVPYADVGIFYTFTGNAPTNVQARVVDSTGKEIVKWTTLTNVVAVGTGWMGTLGKVPQGMTYYTELRDGDQIGNAATTTSKSASSQKWGVGVCIIQGGQSNMVGLSTWGYFTDHKVPGTNTLEYDYARSSVKGWYFYPKAGWDYATTGERGSPARTSFLRIVTKKLKDKWGYDVPVCIIPWCYDSTGMSAFLPSGQRWNELFSSGLTSADRGFSSPAYVYSGDAESMVWHHGETGAETTQQYKSELDTLFLSFCGPQGTLRKFGRDETTFGFYPSVLGSYMGGLAIEHIRKAVLDFEADAKAKGWSKARVGLNCIDLPTDASNTLHILFPNAKIGQRRLIQTMLWHLDCSNFTGAGPRLAGTYTRNGNVVTLPVVQERVGAKLVNKNGGNLTGIYAHTDPGYDDALGTPLLVSAADVAADGQSLVVTVTKQDGSAAPAQFYLKIGGHKYGTYTGTTQSIRPDISNYSVDDTVYPDGYSPTLAAPDIYNSVDAYTGLPVMVTPTPIAITA